ncbi:transmembrane 220 family protein [Arenibacter sp. M-2]|uniref:transmembrane 220 family protein n=1 Tax=unclassified Arenibacter TaxID=2615047 RepID=UPI000D761363|nr:MULTISPECIES: transmembrane 220 family protein [unclassified Arenibacter]MDL5511509.1 transmembrane 220 family protein [Arenibacter sp. M-2]PXX22668.1 transmembrane family 220 protein [Arenibacter sp. ARW7G5Y1]
MRLFSKIFSAVFTVLFVWAALVQYNDPDALMWYLIYGIAAVASFLFFLGKLNLLIPVLLSFAYLIAAWIFWPDQFEGVSIGGGNIDNIEHARESLGLIINALVMLFYAWRVKVVRG